jgi:hypothetical protein
MPEQDPFDEIERRMHIHQLKNEVREITGADFTSQENPDTPPEILEAFWEHVRDFEKAPLVKLSDRWMEAHEPLPPLENLSDEKVTKTLWEIIHWLASRRIFLESTNHLSDRELLAYIRDELFTDEIEEIPFGNWHWDPAGSGSEEDLKIHLQYYADDDTRERWAKDWPELEIPKKETPPYDRDKDLPQASLEPEELPEGWEDEWDWAEEDEDDIRPFQ